MVGQVGLPKQQSEPIEHLEVDAFTAPFLGRQRGVIFVGKGKLDSSAHNEAIIDSGLFPELSGQNRVEPVTVGSKQVDGRMGVGQTGGRNDSGVGPGGFVTDFALFGNEDGSSSPARNQAVVSPTTPPPTIRMSGCCDMIPL